MTKIDKLFSVISSKVDIYESYLNEGATEIEIKEIEKITGLKVPATLFELLQRCNGEKKFLGFLGLGFLSCSEIIMHWKMTKKMYNREDFDEGKRIYYQKELLTEKSLFNPERLPFANDGSGQFLCIDYIPGPKGISGQIIYNPRGEPEPMSVIASDFDDFLSFIIGAIESGKLSVEDNREDYEEDEKDCAEVYFETTWWQDWVEIADRYNLKIGLKTGG